ncbi:hypothetical protein KC909_01390 [Candidatus Dojkabacteria bacterium]|uniref:Uncharacterized protein n=1 Tax=Candidatus Dojkabacteria bacterium TaxID=2099670 RepID=A0A955RJ41_9BACT|nr:hypothetical protein [Candidatus Dojkabacteria bacterium]
MESDIQQIKNDLSDFRRAWNDFSRDFPSIKNDVQNVNDELQKLGRSIENIETRIEAIQKELGVDRGGELSQQIVRIESKIDERDRQITQIMRDLNSVKRIVKNNDLVMKDMRKKVRKVNRNVDELESELVQ